MSLDSSSKQRSCTAVTTPSACVNKAIHHIQDLEVKMEASFQQYDRLCKLENIQWYSDMKITEETKDIWLSASSELKAEEPMYWKGTRHHIVMLEGPSQSNFSRTASTIGICFPSYQIESTKDSLTIIHN